MANPSLPSGDAAAAAPAATRSAQACAASKYQRKRCTPDCILARYFPADNPDQFEAAHNLFGVRNILKTITGLDLTQLSTAMSNIIFQSWMRKEDPVGGCYRIILELQNKINAAIAQRNYLLQYRNNLFAQIQAMNELLQGDQAALPNRVSEDPPPLSPQQQQQEQEQQQKYHNDFCGVEGSGIVEGPEKEINPPPFCSALPPTGSDLWRNLPHPQSGEGEEDKLMADMLQPTQANLQQNQNKVFPIDFDPPPSSSALPPAGSDLRQDHPHHQNGQGDHDKPMADMLQPTHDSLEQDQNEVLPIDFHPPPSWSALPPAGSDLLQDHPHHQNGQGDHDKPMADMLQPTHDNLEQDQNAVFPIDFHPPPSSSALPPAGSDLRQDHPHHQNGQGDHDKPMADMLQQTRHNLEEDPNDVFAFLVDPPPSPTPLPPTGTDLCEDLPQPENGVGDEEKLAGDTLQPTQHHRSTPLTDAVEQEKDQDDTFTFDFWNVYLPPLDDDILPYLTTPECPSLEEILKRP